MIDRTTADKFLTGYQRAWRSNEPDDIRAIFTPDAEYRTEPWATPWRGHDEIVAEWLEAQDAPDEYTFAGDVAAIHDDTAFIEGTTRYTTGRVYRNFWVVSLADDGRARSFTEWFMKEPEKA